MLTIDAKFAYSVFLFHRATTPTNIQVRLAGLPPESRAVGFGEKGVHRRRLARDTDRLFLTHCGN